jgi:hypothetical protein
MVRRGTTLTSWLQGQRSNRRCAWKYSMNPTFPDDAPKIGDAENAQCRLRNCRWLSLTARRG